MINVNNINISNDGKTLNINIEVGNTYNITSIKLWNQNNYKDYATALDLSYKLEQINNKEILIFTKEELNYNSFDGIYFIEIQSNEPDNNECELCPNPLLAVISKLDIYYKCMTELILEADICNTNLFSTEVCDDNKINKALSINLFIEAINQSLELGQFIEAISLLSNLKKLCTKCKSCTTITRPNNCTTCNQVNLYA